MMYEVRKLKHTFLPTQRIFNPPHHKSMVKEELACDDVNICMHT